MSLPEPSACADALAGAKDTDGAVQTGTAPRKDKNRVLQRREQARRLSGSAIRLSGPYVQRAKREEPERQAIRQFLASGQQQSRYGDASEAAARQHSAPSRFESERVGESDSSDPA